MCSISTVDPSVVVVASLACLLGLVLAAAVGYALLRPAVGSTDDRGSSARALLDRRLAMGEIDVDEYYERESALRSAEPARPRRSRGRLRL